MAHLNHEEAFEDFKTNILNGIKTHFPVKGLYQTLVLKDLEVRTDKADPDDIAAQHKAKVSGGTFSRPVYGHVALVDNKTGKELSTNTVRLADIPVLTRRYSYVVGGQEWQITSQWQLRPGVYTRRQDNGELETQFNITNKRDFRMGFDPASKLFKVERGTAKSIAAYPILRAMGATDAQLEKVWGKDVLDANKNARGADTALLKFYKADKKQPPKSAEEAHKYVVDTLTQSQVDPRVTKITIGRAAAAVDSDVLVRATQRLMEVNAGGAPDDRDNLQFKRLRSVGDYAHDKLTHWETRASARTRLSRQVNRAPNASLAIKPGAFNGIILGTFTDNSAARVADQVNTAEMTAGMMQTTVMGPGGVRSLNAITPEMKAINQSHLGFQDTLHTPEGGATGVTLHLPIGVRKVGDEARIPVYNIKTGKKEMVNAQTFQESVVVLPDQLKWKDGVPTPLAAKVKAATQGNDIKEVSMKDAHYAMFHPSQAFSLTTNLIPFMGNNSGNRASYATHHIEQAISLLERDVPHIQVGTGTDKAGIRSFEEFIGRQTGHVAPVAGVVHSVGKDGIVIKAGDGKKHTVNLYNNYPLNDAKSVLHSTPIVEAGQRVVVGQHVADTNFSRNGVLALGKNLHVAYIPYKGYNFEDGIVISESAAQKLRSVHLTKPSVLLKPEDITSKTKFRLQHIESYTADQYENIGDDGTVRVGATVKPGDPLVLASRPTILTSRSGIAAVRKSMAARNSDVSLRWDSEHPGTVTGVHVNKRGETIVHVRTIEPAQVGDKMSGRHGNKGIISKVVPDHEMPHTKDGRVLDVALNPSGVPGRMNVGQVLETVLSKVAHKTGQPIVIDNFEYGVDRLDAAKKLLKAHNLTDTEEFIDPLTKKSLGHALNGYQHMLKLQHQIDKKVSVRSGLALRGEAPEGYDSNLMPVGGGKVGAQSIGSLGLNVLLSRNATANIREMHTWKSEGPDPAPDDRKWASQHHEVWAAIQMGTPLPPPKPTFSVHKFFDMLRASGVNVEKKGNIIQVSPLTDADILAMSHGEVKDPSKLTHAKLDKDGNLMPQKGGLFDERITGGISGRRWSHFTLAEPLPNPMFEEPIKHLLGMKTSEFDAVVGGTHGWKDGKLVPIANGVLPRGVLTGGAAIAHELSVLNTAKELAKAKADLDGMRTTKGMIHGASTQKLDAALKKVKYLTLLHEKKLAPKDAYVLHNVPVIPPAMRNPSVLGDGNVKWEDVNGLYKGLGASNNTLRELLHTGAFGAQDLQEHRAAQYDALKALVGLGAATEKDERSKGFLELIKGPQPKKGYFQKTLLSRRQDMTMRATIIPEPEMGLDDVGLPREKALKLFRPFVVRKMIEMGVAPTPLDAQNILAKKGALKDPLIGKALASVMTERPVLLKRDPALHMHSIQSFYAHPVKGSAIRIHPLVVGGFNADFDGDTMSVYVPLSTDAVEEAKNMLPSKNLFNVSTGKVAFTPSLESSLGLYRMSQVTGSGNKTAASSADAVRMAQAGKLKVDELVNIKGVGKTTVGRVLLSSALPEAMQHKILHDHSSTLGKKGVENLYSDLAQNHPETFKEHADRLKDFGFDAAYGIIRLKHPDKHVGAGGVKAMDAQHDMQVLAIGTHTLSLDDLTPDTALRGRVVAATQKKVDAVNAVRGLTQEQREARTNELWDGALKEMKAKHLSSAKKDNLYKMYDAGIKPGWAQYQQLRLAPMLLEDAQGRTVPTPVTKSYAEGLDVAGYWLQSHGARKGSVQKVQEVSEPGYFSKQLINTTMSIRVNGADCGTVRGVSIPISSSDVHDRELSTDLNVKGKVFHKGTMLTPAVVGEIRKLDKGVHAVVRSTLKCEHGEGVCQHCAGLAPTGKHYALGDNIGVMAAQSLGERSVQLALKSFHSGGVRSVSGAGVLGAFERVQQLTTLPDRIPDAAALAMRGGTVEKIVHGKTGTDVWIDGERHFVGFDRAGRRLTESVAGQQHPHWVPPKVGAKVEAGQLLSDPHRTNINPRDYYEATNNVEKMQNLLTNEIHGIYSGEGVRRQHAEVIVRGMTNLSRVLDPGGAEGVLKGDTMPYAKLRALNVELQKAGKAPVDHAPILKSVKILPDEVHEDWMARLNFEHLRTNIARSAATGAVSDIHGLHPVPGAAYGAEFGIAKRRGLKPANIEHLPEWSY